MGNRIQQSQLQQIVSGLSEGVILIGPDQRITWANAAALAMHGVTAIEQLGHDVASYRANYALAYRNKNKLEDGNAPVDRVVAGEAFHDVVVEVTKTGRDRADWVHSIRSLVLTDDDGKPECLVLTITDVTEQYEAEQRFQSSFHANPAPAAICRLSDLRFIKVNRGFLDMTGYVDDDVVGRSVYEVDVLKRAERRDLAIERLNEGRTIPQMEACLDVPADASKWVIVAGQPIEMPGKVPCMLFTFADLEARRKAEADLKQSQEQFEKSFQLSPVPTVRGRRDGLTITDVNEAFTAMFGYGGRGPARPQCPGGRPVGRPGRPRTLRAPAEARRHGAGLRGHLEDQGGARDRLPDLRRHGADRRRPLDPVHHPGHHRAQAVRDRAEEGHRGRHDRRLLVQPKDPRQAGLAPDHLRLAPQPRRPRRPDGARSARS